MIAGLHWEEHGPADGPPLILSAGLGGSGEYWRPNLAALAARNRVILYDHRGTARSDRALPPRLTVEHMADDLLALIDGLGLAQAAVAGHALGGMIGLALALKAPERVRALAIVNGWAALDSHTARCFETRLALLRDSGVDAFLRAQPIFLYSAFWSSTHREQLDRELEHQRESFPGAATVEARVAAAQAFHAADRLGEVSVPVLAIAAGDDILVPFTRSREIADGVPGGRLALMSGGHACNVTDPDTFAAILLQFLGS